MKFDKLYEKVINEGKLIGKILIINKDEDYLGPDYPFKMGDKVKLIRFVGYQGNDEEYEIQDLKDKTKTALITTDALKK